MNTATPEPTTGDRHDPLWLTDTLTRASLRYGRALHELSNLPGLLALARLWDHPEATDVQDAATEIEKAVRSAIDELDRLAEYVEAITDPGQAVCADCNANVSLFHGAADFTHWRWITDADAPAGRRVQPYAAGHEARPFWRTPPRPDWSTDDADLTPDTRTEQEQPNA